jgi:hypothetical protein
MLFQCVTHGTARHQFLYTMCCPMVCLRLAYTAPIRCTCVEPVHYGWTVQPSVWRGRWPGSGNTFSVLVLWVRALRVTRHAGSLEECRNINPRPAGHRMDCSPQMSCSPSSATNQPNPTPSSITPTYEPVGIFWDYGQPILALSNVPKLNPARELPAVHQCLWVQARR